jgi:hypothetical protein
MVVPPGGRTLVAHVTHVEGFLLSIQPSIANAIRIEVPSFGEAGYRNAAPLAGLTA